MRDLIDIILDYFSHVTISMKGTKDFQDMQGQLGFLGRIVGELLKNMEKKKKTKKKIKKPILFFYFYIIIILHFCLEAFFKTTFA